MGALGLGYLDTPVFFWAAQLPGGLGTDQTRPDRAPEGEGRAGGGLGGLAGWQSARKGLSQGPDDQPAPRTEGWWMGPTGAPQVLYRGYWVPQYMRQKNPGPLCELRKLICSPTCPSWHLHLTSSGSRDGTAATNSQLGSGPSKVGVL